jgi:hypothetical protein
MSADFSLPFAGLIPERILDAVESLGLRTDGRLIALNSFENRVYQVGMDGRPAGDGEILPPEPLERGADPRGARLHVQALANARDTGRRRRSHIRRRHAGARLGDSASRCSRAAAGARRSSTDRDTLAVDRPLHGTHPCGGALIRPFAARPALDIDDLRHREPRAFLLEQGPRCRPEHRATPGCQRGRTCARSGVQHCWQRAGQVRNIRLHGDCHAGNVLWTERGGNSEDPGGPHFVDFDDSAERTRGAGPVDAAVGRRRGDEGAAAATCSPATRISYEFDPTASCSWSRRCARCA